MSIFCEYKTLDTKNINTTRYIRIFLTSEYRNSLQPYKLIDPFFIVNMGLRGLFKESWHTLSLQLQTQITPSPLRGRAFTEVLEVGWGEGAF